ncbi:MAG: VTT domain-containing protein [Gemmatimonadota bacterium]|nr:MAG: VTT domain-containing protein [Gemmatimonadota bacterium]
MRIHGPNVVQAIARVAAIPIAPDSWTFMLRSCGLAALGALLVALLIPAAADLAAFYTIMLFACGPTSAFLPAASEPVLLAFGQFYSPLLLATIGSGAVFTVEFLNYRMFDAILHCDRLQKVRSCAATRLMVRWFDRLPFVTVATAALTPIPFWIARTCAVLSRYSIPRYMTATTLGRFVRLFLICAVGSALTASPQSVLVVAFGLIVAVGGIGFLRRKCRQRSRALMPIAVGEAPSR